MCACRAAHSTVEPMCNSIKLQSRRPLYVQKRMEAAPAVHATPVSSAPKLPSPQTPARSVLPPVQKRPKPAPAEAGPGKHVLAVSALPKQAPIGDSAASKGFNRCIIGCRRRGPRRHRCPPRCVSDFAAAASTLRCDYRRRRVIGKAQCSSSPAQGCVSCAATSLARKCSASRG